MIGPRGGYKPKPITTAHDSEGHRLFALHQDLINRDRGYAAYQLAWERLTPTEKARWRVLAHEFGRDYERTS